MKQQQIDRQYSVRQLVKALMELDKQTVTVGMTNECRVPKAALAKVMTLTFSVYVGLEEKEFEPLV